MNKDLEALGIFTYELSKRYPHDLALQEYFCKVADLVNKTTPPTVEQLCEELGEYFEQDVKCIYGMFYYGEDLQFTEICDTTIDDLNGDQLYDIYLSLPSTILKRIAQFYENEVKE